MVRLIAIAAGLVFGLVAFLAFINGAYAAATEEAVHTAEHEFHLYPREAAFQHDGPLGTWDIASLQRGYKVYKEVCSACHSMKFVAFRNLEQLGYSEAQVKAEAATWQVPGIDPDTGEATTRAGEPTDYFPSPYPNDIAAAAANNNAVPPDMSLITKARHDGSNYVYSLLTGYRDLDTWEKDGVTVREEFPDFSTPTGLYFNPYFPNLNIAMAPPLTSAGQVTFDDGTEATIDQMAHDVAAFLTWTAEPSLIKRKQTGWAVMGFLLFATILAYFSKKQIWAAVKPEKTSRKSKA